MPLRAMNNFEKSAAKVLKEAGFFVFWFDSGPHSSGYYATHPKLISQYCIATCSDIALEDIKKKEDYSPKPVVWPGSPVFDC